MGHLVTLVLSCSLLVFATLNVVVANDVGINWSRNFRLKLLPSNVVDMILSNGIKKARLHSFVGSVARAFTGSNLEMVTTLANIDMIMVNDSRKAKAYVAENVTRAYARLDLNVKTIVIGNEPYTIVDNYPQLYQDDFAHSIGYITEALKVQPPPYNHIKATMAHAPDVLAPDFTKPSEANSNDNVNERMHTVLTILNQSGAPFSINMHPHLSIVEKKFPLDFAFFDSNSTFSITDGPNAYTNIFDFIYDSFAWALRKKGFGNIKIIVTQIGWLTGGRVYANISIAKRFYRGFLNKMANNRGTPLFPGVPIDTYIFNLNYENMKNTGPRGPTIRHYGIYDYKGDPKFHIDLTMKGRRNAKLVPAQGVNSMPNRWCIYNPDAEVKDENKTEILLQQFEYACNCSDCTTLLYGSMHNNLTFEGNISYAFNDFFQANNQLESACDFKGLGKITVENPSLMFGCEFPLQIISTMFKWGQGEMGNILTARGVNAVVTKVSGAPVRKGSGFIGIVVPLILSTLLS